ncbi:MAG: hypothetical protein QM754_05330 [Tepidisphaeraceae bacterium]
MIPHLTELAHQYSGKVTFVGVSVWERPEDETDAGVKELVLPFVQQMGEKMDYNVAYDGAAGAMAKTWLEPAKQKGIPTSFVVNGEGKIAWIGYPAELDKVLPKVVDGSWDIAAEKKKQQEAEIAAANSPEKKLTSKLMNSRRAKDNAAVLATLDEIDAQVPQIAGHPDFLSMRLEALFRSDPEKAVAFVQKLTGPDGIVTKKPDFSFAITRVVPMADKSLLSQSQWKAIADAIDPAIAPGTSENGSTYLPYAELLARAGETDKAIFYQRKAVNLILAFNNSRGGKLSKIDADYLKAAQAKLDELTAHGG